MRETIEGVHHPLMCLMEASLGGLFHIIIKAVNGILQMLVDFAAADELEHIPAFDLLVEQFKALVVVVVGVPFDARGPHADLVERRGVLRNVGEVRDGALARVPNPSTTASAIFRMSGSKLGIPNSMMAFAVALR